MGADTWVIINADDFGWTKGINDGVIEAHRHGVLTSATLLASAPATDHAVELAKRFPVLSVGVHLSYGLGEPLLATRELDILYHPDGRLKLSGANLWMAATMKEKVRRQLDRHFRSQVEAVIAKGIPITHLDTHKHLHFWPAVFAIVAKIAADFEIPAIRYIRENPLDPGPASLKARAALAALAWTWPINRKTLARHNLAAPDRLAGINQTGFWTKRMFLDILRTVKRGVTEIMTHPGHPDGLENEPTRLVESRRTELSILTYPLVREFFYTCQSNIKLIGYRDLPSPR